jgi:SAM-dependent methyltransferase
MPDGESPAPVGSPPASASQRQRILPWPTIKDRLARVGVHRVAIPLENLYRRISTRRPPLEAPESPLPPPKLMVRTTGTADAQWFLSSGRLAAGNVVAVLDAHTTRSPEHSVRVLDFGGGSGRVSRHLIGDPGIRLTLCDQDRDAAGWCAAHLSVEAHATSPSPPTDFEASSFDCIFGFSVFTHITEAVQRRWVDEFHRILASDGLLVLSLHGSPTKQGRLSPEQQTQFDAGEIVVYSAGAEFTNWCCAYHPDAAVHQLMDGQFRVISHTEEGASGNPPQDLWVFQRIA